MAESLRVTFYDSADSSDEESALVDLHRVSFQGTAPLMEAEKEDKLDVAIVNAEIKSDPVWNVNVDSFELPADKNEATATQTMLENLTLSNNVKRFLGDRAPANTRNSNMYATRLFSQFTIAYVGIPEEDSASKRFLTEATVFPRPVPGANDDENALLRILLNGRSASEGFDDACRYRLRHFIIEFSTSYVSKETNREV